jgi:hypothetical protein
MKTFYTSCLIFGILITLHAQQAAPQNSVPPLPPGPLLKRAPDYSTWTVTCLGHANEGGEPSKTTATGEAPPKDKQKESVTMVSTVVKTGSTILEQNVEANGERHQIWHFSGVRIVSGTSDPVIGADYGGDDIFSINFASTDFAGLDWVSQSTYAGMAKYQGNDCIVFKGTVSPLSVRAQIDEREDIAKAKAFGESHSEKAMVPATAYIDLQTRLPLVVSFGKETRFYQYGAPPTAPLALPPALAGPVQEYEQRIKRLSAPAARAY